MTTEPYTHRTSKMFLEDMELERKFRKKNQGFIRRVGKEEQFRPKKQHKDSMLRKSNGMN